MPNQSIDDRINNNLLQLGIRLTLVEILKRHPIQFYLKIQTKAYGGIQLGGQIISNLCV